MAKFLSPVSLSDWKLPAHSDMKTIIQGTK